MASSNEDEAIMLREQNSELVVKVQFWKMKAAQQETEKLELMKENNNLRLKLSRLRNGGVAHARALHIAHQAASEEALSHMVQASNLMTKTVEMTKSYLRQREELEAASPRWSTLSSSPDNNKIHKVPPLLMGGKTIQPFVSLSRVPMNESNSNSSERSPNQSRNTNERLLPLPMHVLQDVYIPLRRLDASELMNHYAAESDNAGESAGNNMLLEDSAENELGESQNISEDDINMSNQQLAVVPEDDEDSEDDDDDDDDVDDNKPVVVNRIDNPLEGPSWLLDRPRSESRSRKRRSKSCVTLEADSTTEPEESRTHSPAPAALSPLRLGDETRVFTPTVRRRKRTSSPPPGSPAPPSPALSAHDLSPRLPTHTHRHGQKSRMANSRVLKVIVPKMRLEATGGDTPPSKRLASFMREAAGGDTPPSKRLASFDAPSPNGATDAALIVVDQHQSQSPEESLNSEPAADESHTSINARSTSGLRDRSLAAGHRSADTTPTIDAHAGSRSSHAHANSRNSDVDARTSSIFLTGLNSDAHGSRNLGSDVNASARSRADDNVSVRSRADANVSARSRADDNVSVRSRADANVSVRSRSRPLGSDANGSGRTTGGRGSRDGDDGAETSGRTRRPKKQVVYKEKPLNRKLRR